MVSPVTTLVSAAPRIFPKRNREKYDNAESIRFAGGQNTYLQSPATSIQQLCAFLDRAGVAFPRGVAAKLENRPKSLANTRVSQRYEEAAAWEFAYEVQGKRPKNGSFSATNSA
jgi:hypothetical protein